MLRKQVFLLLFILAHPRDSSCIINSLYETGEEIWKLYSMMDRIEFNTSSAFEELFIGENGSNDEITKQLGSIYKRFDEVEESMDFIAARETFKQLPSYMNLFRDFDRMEIFFQNIDEYHDEFHRFITGNSSYPDETFRNFARRMTLNVEGAIQVLQKILTDDEEFSVYRKNLVSMIGDHATSQRAKICNGPQMISSILVQLFKKVMLAEMKSSLMLSFANIYRYIDETDDLFIELEETIQSTIFRYRWSPCKFFSCNTIWSEYPRRCQAVYHNHRSVCPNNLVECVYLEAVQACQLKSGPYKFQYVNSTELGLLGRDPTCPKDNGHIIQDGSGWNFTHSVCACNCYGDRNKISLAIIRSNVKGNMVITGIRFLKHNRILYIQPREGKLSNDGHIIQYSERWIPIPRKINQSDIRSVNRMNRIFYFDDLRLPFGFVLTGVKFKTVKRGNVRGFAIGIFGSPFDYKSGKINGNERYQISEPGLNDDPGKLLSFTAVSSIHTNLTHIVSPRDIKYVSLERSTLRDDFGQSTLPLFDAIPITSKPSSPLGGIGIFHKGVEGYAGFISLRIFGINYANYFLNFESDHLKDGRIKFNHSYYH